MPFTSGSCAFPTDGSKSRPEGESSGESVVGGEGVGACGGFIVVVVDQKTSFGYDFSTDHLTTIVSSVSYFESTEREHSRPGFNIHPQAQSRGDGSEQTPD